MKNQQGGSPQSEEESSISSNQIDSRSRPRVRTLRPRVQPRQEESQHESQSTQSKKRKNPSGLDDYLIISGPRLKVEQKIDHLSQDEHSRSSSNQITHIPPQ